MKKSFFKTHVFTTTLLGVLAVVGFAQFTLANIWQPPTGPNVPAPINSGSTSQIKGGPDVINDTDAIPASPNYLDTSLTLLKSGALSTGLFTEGFLSLGHVPTFGFISASLAKIGGVTSTSRIPFLLHAGADAPLANIVLSNLGGTNTTRLGVWSEKDAAWANTRIKNGYFNNLLVKGGDDLHQMTYTAGGITYTTPASYTRRFMGFLFGAPNANKPSTNDPDFFLNAPTTPDTIVNCNLQATFNGIGSYNGTHRYCVFNNSYVYEMVPPTNLDVAGETDIGNGGTCVIRNTDECPLGSYLQKIGTFRNNVCKAFNGTCTAPNAPNPTLNEGINGAYGAVGVAWLEAEKIAGAQNMGGVNVNQQCSLVGSNGTPHFFANPEQYTAINLPGIDGEAHAGTVIYTPGSYMTQSPSAGVYRVLFDPNASTHYSLTLNNATKYIMQIGQAGEIITVSGC